MIEARRSPDGYIAQRFPDIAAQGRDPWILTLWRPTPGMIGVEFLTDAQVADWPILSEAPARSGCPCGGGPACRARPRS